MDAGCSVGASAVTEREFAVFEVAEELGPFFIGRAAVLRGRA